MRGINILLTKNHIEAKKDYFMANFFRKKQKRKALILTGFDIDIHTGGIETFNRHLRDLLKKLGFNVQMFYASDFQNEFQIYNDWFGMVYQMGQYVEGLFLNKDDIVILNGYYGGGYIKKKVKTYTVFHSVHPFYAEAVKDFMSKGQYWELKHVVGDIFEKNAINNSDIIISVSKGVKTQLNEYYGINPEKIVKINNPVDTNAFFPLCQEKINELKKHYGFENKKIGLFVGRWEDAKGTRLLEKMIKENKDILWIAVNCSGGGNIPVYENVRIYAEKKKEELHKFYNIADFLFFPSYYEGFGLVMAEAFSCGCPAIGKTVGFLDDYEFLRYVKERVFFYDITTDNGKKFLSLKKIRDIIDNIKKKNYTLSEKVQMHNFISKNLSITLWEKHLKKIFI